MSRERVLARRVRWLVTATICYNTVEAGVSMAAGVGASSAALIGFGLDSVIEVVSAAAVAWQFASRDPEARERTALGIIAWSFFALAVYVTADAVHALAGTGEVRHSPAGVAVAAVGVVVMPVLSWTQRRAGCELGSASAVADSEQTLLCAWLSAALLAGLLLNIVVGWSWADPIAALVIAVVAVKEGLDARRGRTCCAIPAAAHTPLGHDDCGCA